MVHAGLGLKSLSGFIWLSSQTHTERVGDVSKYLLCSCEGGAAPQLLYRGTAVCFRRRYSSSRANTWHLQLHEGLGMGAAVVATTSQSSLCFLPVPALCPPESAVPLLSRDRGCFQRLRWSWLMHES